MRHWTGKKFAVIFICTHNQLYRTRSFKWQIESPKGITSKEFQFTRHFFKEISKINYIKLFLLVMQHALL